MYQQFPEQLERKLQQELHREERIKWVGAPVPRLFRLDTFGIYLFAIPWTAFALFWMAGAAGFKMPDLSKGIGIQLLFPLFGVPFVVVGLFMLATPFLKYFEEKNTLYAITDRRVIILKKGKSLEIALFEPHQIEEIVRRERGETGDLIFAHKRWRDSDGDRRSEEIGFFNVLQVREAHEALNKLAQNSTKRLEEKESEWKLAD